jgi:hypothetical protein
MTAMLYLLMMTTLATAMFAVTGGNMQTASNLEDSARARAAAESGLRWMDYRFKYMSRPRTTSGTITTTVATSIWPSLRDAIASDLQSVHGTTGAFVTVNTQPFALTSAAIPTDSQGTFAVNVQQLSDPRFVRVIATGSYRNSVKSVSRDYQIDKKVKFAVVGKVEVQLGKNTLVEGPLAMATPNKFPPYLSLSDFKHLTSALDTKLNNFETFLKGNHNGYDGRISVNNSKEYTAATTAGYADVNKDGFIDEYDLFLKEFDSDKDGRISKAEFTNSSTGKLYDTALFAAIEALGGPAKVADGYVDNYDAYAKVRGQVLIADSAASWASNLASGSPPLTINDMMQGPIVSTDPTEPPIKWNAGPADIFDLSPANFDQCCTNYMAKTGAAAGASSRTATVISNSTLSAAWANNGTVNEQTPFGSTSWQATYQRPYFKNITFNNVIIPKGLNALFDNCTFNGVTYADMTHDITSPTGGVTTDPNDGMTWAKKMKSGTFSSSTVLTSTNSYGYSLGNNIRFNDCKFNGPLVSGNATAYTHFSNSWEFTGATAFNNQVDQTATIVCPNTNIEMGSFSDPAASPSTLIGVVVAGNIDIRGMTYIDGSIIVTGNGAGNTTLGWFGNNDANTDPNSVPPEGWGKINVHYNPTRAMPDGINLPVDLMPVAASYREGT